MSIIRDLAVERKDMLFFTYDKIEIDPTFNVRVDYGNIPELAADIAQNGLNQPLIVRFVDGRIILVDGHRRHRAIGYAINTLHAPIESIKCILENKGSNEETRLIAMFSTGANVKPLTTTEQAAVVKRLIDLGSDVKKIAIKFGRPVSFVNDLLNLNGASTEIRQAVEKKQITKTAAKKLIKASGVDCTRLLGKGVKVKVSDVEKVTKGSASLITAASIRVKIKEVTKHIPENPLFYGAVRDGMEYALGIRELPTV